MLKALRTLLALIIWSCSLAAVATAQEPTPVAEERLVDCSRINPAKTLTRFELQTAQLCQEVSKLQEEVQAIKTTNRTTRGVLGQLTPWTGLISAVVTLVVGGLGTILGFWFRSSFEKSQKQKLEQERILQRETHNLKLFEGLSSDNRSVQLATVSALLKRIEYIRTQPSERATSLLECITVSDVVVSVLRDPNVDESVSKYVADEIIDALGARKSPKSNAEKAWRNALPKGPPPFPLSDLNFQRTRLRNVYWAGVQAGGTDFYMADLSGASLAFANLSQSVLYGANLTNAVLTGANLTNANLEGANLCGAKLEAANLSGVVNIDQAVFDSTTTWDAKTAWPVGFDPAIRLGLT